MANWTETTNPQTSWHFVYIYFLIRKLCYPISFSVAVFGVIFNLICILVFVKMKLKDNVNITLFFLAVSDLMYLLAHCPHIMSPVLTPVLAKRFPKLRLAPGDHVLLFGTVWLSAVFNGFSALVSVFLAVVRCMCVAKPLKFKSMFTKQRTLSILGVLFVAAVAQTYAQVAVIKLIRAVNPRTNSTYLAIRLRDNVHSLMMAHDIFNKAVLIWLMYIIFIVCTCVLASKLRAASKFRRSLAAARGPGKDQAADQIPGSLKSSHPSGQTESSERSEKLSRAMSTKELQVVKSVILICVLYVVSLLPLLVLSVIRLFYAESLSYIFDSIYVASTPCMFLNASVNMFVYIRFNTRFREKFFDLFNMK
ncbi:chemosensory receptor C [Elysia marginata]|uniref:Chemosensory receptor C n=1 Tax=Elysia marginata TaxID=1093978 RepID=A0AAV4FCX4_9GAST|nr:chemosensory receptor C [Elysia marginata]